MLTQKQLNRKYSTESRIPFKVRIDTTPYQACVADLRICSLFNDLTQAVEDDADTSKALSRMQVYHREIVLTFRVVFGQDKKSSSRQNLDSSVFVKMDSDAGNERDPLLQQLCTKDWNEAQIYSDIRSEPVKTAYLADQDFPYFADRLLALQDFVLTQNPDDFWTLLADRRDMNRLWTVRAAVVFGGLVLILTILQLVFAITQVAMAV
ncbi:hypothetical protein ACHAPI_011421 [Fusarium lateritium]